MNKEASLHGITAERLFSLERKYHVSWFYKNDGSFNT